MMEINIILFNYLSSNTPSPPLQTIGPIVTLALVDRYPYLNEVTGKIVLSVINI